MDMISRDEIREIANRGTPPTELELNLMQLQGVVDGVREGEQSRMGHVIEDGQPDSEKNQ